jgi:hypothetical protein
VTSIEVIVAAVTVSVVEPVTPDAVALIELEPSVLAVAIPLSLGVSPLAAVLPTVATATFEDAQVADSVTFCVVASEKVSVAVNACVVPFGADGAAGVSARLTATASVTVTLVLAVNVSNSADTEAVPGALAVTLPLSRAASPTDALAGALEVHVALVVTSYVVESENVAVAVSCTVVPSASDGSVGEIARLTGVAAVTVAVVVPLIPLIVAVITVLPTAAPKIRPLSPTVLPTATAAGVSDDHAAEAVTLTVLPSE